MRRRFIYDAASDRVVEIGTVKVLVSATERYADEQARYREQFNRDATDYAGQRLREATLERAARREFAFKRFGDERRWAE